MARVFLLYANNGNNRVGVAILPESSDTKAVIYEWSYSVRYSADGLDVPNYEKAMQLLQERNPSWEVIPGQFEGVTYQAKVLEQQKS